MNPVTSALFDLHDQLVQAECLADSFDLAGGDNPPSWVYVFRTQINALRKASNAVDAAVRGDGGYAPHGGTDDDASGSIPRATQTPCPGASCVS